MCAYKDRRREHKHASRREFQRQLKRLWNIVPSLKIGNDPSGIVLLVAQESLDTLGIPHTVRLPEASEDYANRKLADEEKPFFVLLEDDRLLSKLSVDTDQMLDMDGADDHWVSLVIKAHVRPSVVHTGNVYFT